VTIYDKAKWHFESSRYPKELPEENAYISGGIYLAWLFQRDLLEATFIKDWRTDFRRRASGKLSCGKLFEVVGGILEEGMLTDEGREFTEFYYDDLYLDDLMCAIDDDAASIFHIEDSESTYQAISEMISTTYDEWKSEAD
jgi:hypothetical protein